MKHKTQDLKVLNYLKAIKKESPFSEGITYRFNKFNVPSRQSINVVIAKKGIIKNIGTKMEPIWVWNTINPNIKMAQEIYKLVRNQTNMRNAKRKESSINKSSEQLEIVTNNDDVIDELSSECQNLNIKVSDLKKELEKRKREVKEKKEETIISLFWGLIKISK